MAHSFYEGLLSPQSEPEPVLGTKKAREQNKLTPHLLEEVRGIKYILRGTKEEHRVLREHRQSAQQEQAALLTEA